MPPSVEQEMPPDTVELFRRCVGRMLRIDNIDEHGHLELNLTSDGQQMQSGFSQRTSSCRRANRDERASRLVRLAVQQDASAFRADETAHNTQAGNLVQEEAGARIRGCIGQVDVLDPLAGHTTECRGIQQSDWFGRGVTVGTVDRRFAHGRSIVGM